MTAIFTSVLFLHSSNFAVIKSVIYSVISKSLHLLTGISNLLQSVIRQLWLSVLLLCKLNQTRDCVCRRTSFNRCRGVIVDSGPMVDRFTFIAFRQLLQHAQPESEQSRAGRRDLSFACCTMIVAASLLDAAGEFLQNGVTVLFGFDFGSSSSSGWWQQGAVSTRGCSGWIAQCER
jgi:hypothetical protein